MSHSRTYLSLDAVRHTRPAAFEAMCGDFYPDAFIEMAEAEDLSLFLFNEELYSESHDEMTCHVWRGGVWREIVWEERPL